MSDLATSSVDAIFADLRDRRFLKWLFDARGDECLIGRFDDGEELRGLDLEVQQDIRKAWAAIIASRISQQDAELERVRRELEEARKALETIAGYPDHQAGSCPEIARHALGTNSPRDMR